ncbi:MAG: VIT1/CCC1 transporter family protein [Pseudonocardia sp.]|nr:VIT1/CCC1 transporter family protein [Pseudonocardia sp.]
MPRWRARWASTTCPDTGAAPAARQHIVIGGDRSGGPPEPRGHPGEGHGDRFRARLNWRRAGVLGAKDGIVSAAGLVVGVAGVTTGRGPLLTVGIAGLVGDAVSMALGEYFSVSRDAELDMESDELTELFSVVG